jgi:hypothetical protein
MNSGPAIDGSELEPRGPGRLPRVDRREMRGENMGDSLARYDEVRPNGRRSFELFADRMIVRSRSARLDSEITIMLADLRPEPNRLLVRPKEFGLGLLMLVGSLVTAIVGGVVRGSAPVPDEKHLIWFACAGALAFVAMVIFSKTARKVEFIQFVSHNGHPLLDVARAGPQRAEFDPFVQTLIARIPANRKDSHSMPADL